MATIDITGAYLCTDSDEEFIMILKVILAVLLVNIYHNLYRKYDVLEKLVKVIYVKLKKYLYELLRIALLFYPKLEADLENDCFIINLYDSCGAKKMAKGEAMTVV